MLVGDCAPQLRSRADGHIADLLPGAGALAGIISALSAAHDRAQTAVLILAGDLPRITPEAVRSILAAAARSPDAPAVVAFADGVQPCIALYRAAALAPLRDAASAGPRTRPLTDIVQSIGAATVPIDPLCALNVNTPRDLESFQR